MPPATTEPQPSVLITGASGLIGTRVCTTLKDRYRLFGLDLASPDDRELPLEHVPTDLTDDASVQHALAQVRALTGDRLAASSTWPRTTISPASPARCTMI